MENTYVKGSAERKVPRSGIVARLIASFGGAELDRAFLARYGQQIQLDGISPAEALARYHRTPQFKADLYQRLGQHFGPQGLMSQDVISVITHYVEQYIAA
jgi:hypothetical protein